MRDYRLGPIIGVGYAILCGVLFLFVQGREYYLNSFTIADRVFGSTFYLLTGFHGFHVLIGTLWLIVRFCRLILGHFSLKKHFGLEACFWY